MKLILLPPASQKGIRIKEDQIDNTPIMSKIMIPGTNW